MTAVFPRTEGTSTARACGCPSRQALAVCAHRARRAWLDGRCAIEDFAIDAGLRVRKHPLSAVAIANGIGIPVGSAFGFALSRGNRADG